MNGKLEEISTTVFEISQSVINMALKLILQFCFCLSQVIRSSVYNILSEKENFKNLCNHENKY